MVLANLDTFNMMMMMKGLKVFVILQTCTETSQTSKKVWRHHWPILHVLVKFVFFYGGEGLILVTSQDTSRVLTKSLFSTKFQPSVASTQVAQSTAAFLNVHFGRYSHKDNCSGGKQGWLHWRPIGVRVPIFFLHCSGDSLVKSKAQLLLSCISECSLWRLLSA